MASFYLSPISPFLQVFTDAGIPLGGALLWTYLAGTSTPAVTYTDITGGTPNANPIQMASNGRLPNVEVWQPGGVTMKYVFSTNAGTTGSPIFGVQIGPTLDQVTGINDPAATTATLANASNGQGADLVANAMRSFDLFASGRAWTPPTFTGGQTLVVCFEGGSSVNDGLGGFFEYSASSSAVDDGLNVIKPNVSGNGRLIRLFLGIFGQTFTATLTGMTSTTTGTITYSVNSRSVATLQCTAAITGTSNAITMSMTGLPAAVIPATAASTVPCIVRDNGNSNLMGWVTFAAGGGVSFALGANPNFTGFTVTGSKGLPAGWTATYALT